MNNNDKYVGMDVHLATTTCVVMDSAGKELISTVLQTKEELIRSFLRGLDGAVHLVFEEGTLAQWMYEITQPVVDRVVVLNPRQYTDKGKKDDKMDTRKMTNMLRLNVVKPVYHHHRRSRSEIKQLVKIYNQMAFDRARAVNRLKALFREQAMTISLDEIEENILKLPTAAHRDRAELLLSQLESVSALKQKARTKMLKQARKDEAFKLLQTILGISCVRASQLLAWVITPHRFRTKRQFWSYCGLSVITRSSSDYRPLNGRMVRITKPGATQGLTKDYHRGMKSLFKSAALDALKNRKIRKYYENLLKRGLKEPVARVQLARKLAAACLAVWKSGQPFDIETLVSD